MNAADAGTRLTAVVLAAGGGSRLGRGPKALLPFRGRPLLDHVTQTLFDGGCDDVVVVLGADAQLVRGQCHLERCTVVENAAWTTGMASSFTTGIGTASAEAVLIALVDQPGITTQVVRRLIKAHGPGRVTAARYDDGQRPSHPMIFDAALARQAAELAADDAGARVFLRSHPELIDAVDCAGLGSPDDVDTEADLHLLD